MTQVVGTEISFATSSQPTSSQTRWRKFEPNIPAPYEIVEIRRLNDDKSILRARAEMPPSFDWRRAEWRPL